MNDKKTDLEDRLNAISIPELRKRIDRVLAHLREIRRSIAVHAGMTLEEVPGPIPSMDDIHLDDALALITELLPVLRAPVPPKQRRKRRSRNVAEKKALEDALEQMAQMDPKVFNEAMKEAGLEFSHEHVTQLKEGAIKMEMLGEVEEEVRAIGIDLSTYRDKLTETTLDKVIGWKRS